MSVSVKDKQFIVVGMEHYNPLGVIRSLGGCGVNPVYIAIKHKCALASLSKYVGEVRHVDTIEEAVELLLREYGDPEDKPFLITTDDDVQSLIDLRWSEFEDRFIGFNSGEDGRTTKFMDKKEILDCAERNGLRVPKTVVVDRGIVPEDVEYPIITKSISPNDGGWKSDVFICESDEELAEAFTKIQSEKVLIQQYIEKSREICIDGYSVDEGRLTFMPMYTTYKYNLKGYYSPYMSMHPYDLPELDKGIRDLFEDVGFEGIFTIEFIVDQNDVVYFMEVNFRNSPWNYAATKMGMPYPYLWAESMLTSSIPASYYKPVPDGFTAMIEPVDYQKRVVEGTTDVSQWLIDFKEVDCPYYMDPEDTEPFKALIENWELLG